MAQKVGFDIGEKNLKMVLYTGKKFKNAVSAEIPDNLVSGGEILSTEAMADFIKHTAKSSSIPRSEAFVVIPSELVYTKTATFPAMTEKQLRYNLPFEFRDYITTDKSEYYFDYALNRISYDDQGAPTEIEVFACAVLKSTIDKYRAVLNKAGFKLKSAVPAEAAFLNILESNPKSNGNECFVDIGYSGSRILIYNAGTHDISRRIDIGLRELDMIISDEFGVDEHIAHSYVLRNYENCLEREACEELYNKLAVEVMKAVNFYNYNSRGESFERIHLCGGGAANKPLCEAIRSVTQVDIIPDEEMIGSSDIDVPGVFMQACGAAIG